MTGLMAAGHADRTRRLKGFTLIELLVVVAIVAALIGVLLPALGRARDSGRTIQCSANLRTMQTGWQVAIDNNRGRIPRVKFLGTNPTWVKELLRVFRDAPPIFGNNAHTFATCPEVQRSSLPTYYLSFYWGFTVNHLWRDGEPNDLKMWDHIRRPSEYPWFMDGDTRPWSGGLLMAESVPYSITGAPNWGIGAYHDNDRLVNVTFADHSVRAVPMKEIQPRMVSPSFEFLENR